MARYWIGDGGNWSDTAHWSDSTGGTGGFSVPSSADDVYFDGASFSAGAQVVALDVSANCLSLDFTGIDQTATLSSSLNSAYIYGDLTLAANLTWTFTGTAYVYMKAVDSRNITTNGITPAFNRFYMDGVGGTWVNQDNFICSGVNMYLTNGTWNTNSKTITIYSLEHPSGVRNLILGASIFTTTQWNPSASGVLNSFQCGTSSVTVINTFYGGYTFYDVTFVSNFSGIIYGDNTYHNMTMSGSTVACARRMYGNSIINNNLTIEGGNATTQRILIYSGTLGSAFSITVDPAKVTASNVDFRDIKFTNPIDLSTITGNSGDCGGNSNITFTTTQTQFFKHTSGAVSWSDSTKWFTATNGGGVAGRVPLPQDDVWFDANSFNGVSTLTVDCPRIGRSLDMSGVGQAVTTIFALNTESYGNFISGINITITHSGGGYIRTLMGIGNFTINTYNISLTAFLNIVRGSYTALSNITLIGEAANQFTLSNTASFYFNGFNYSGILISSSTSGTLDLGSGTITLSSGSGSWSGYINVFAATNLIAINSTIVLSTNSNPTSDNPRISAVNKVLGKVIVGGTTTKEQNIVESCTINELIINNGKTLKIYNGKTVNIAKITAKGTNTNKITIGSRTAAVATINYTGTIQPDIKFADISYITATNPFKVRASTDSGNNTGITFNPARFWVGGTGNVSDPLHWSDTSGGVASETLGSDIMVGGDFESGLVGAKGDGFGSVSTWSLNTISPISGTQDGRLIITTPYGNRPYLTSWISTITTNKWYKFSFEYKVNSGTAIIASLHDGANLLAINQSLTGTGTYIYYFRCTVDNNLLGTIYFGNSVCDVQIDNVAINEVTSAMPSTSTDVFFDENSLGLDARVVTMNSTIDCLSLDFENLTNTMSLVNSTWNLNVYGSLILSATKLTTSFSSTGYLYLKATTSQAIVTNGCGLTNFICFDGVGGIWTNQDNANFSSINLMNGTWNTNDKTISFGQIRQLNNGTKVWNLGASIVNAGNGLILQNFVGLTVNAGTSTIKITGDWCDGAGCTFNNIELTKGSSMGGWLSNLTCANLIATSTTIPINGAITITNTLTLQEFYSLQRITIYSYYRPTQCTITAENILFSNLNLRDINLQGNCVKDLSAIAGGAQDLGNNSNIRFSPSLKKKGRQLGYNIGSPKQSTNGVQIGDQVWTAKNYNESTIGSLVIPEVQEATNVEQITNHTFDTSTDWSEAVTSGRVNISGGTANFITEVSYLKGVLPAQKTGRFYKLTYAVTATNGGVLQSISLGNINMPTTLGVQTVYGKFTYYENSLMIYSSSFVGSIDNVYLELIGWTNSTTLYDARIAAGDTVDQASAAAAMWCNYNNLQANGDVYGKLYNWYAVSAINAQLVLINSDWRVPTSTQFTTLQTYLGGINVAGGKLKELGLSHWVTPNLKGDNSSGFNAFAGGERDSVAGFRSFGYVICFSTIPELDTSNAPRFYPLWDRAPLVYGSTSKATGNSLRLIKK